jgi:hypothetical protein
VRRRGAAGARERLHPDHAGLTATLLDQRRQRHRENALADEAIAADAVAVGLELAERVDHDGIPGGHSGLRLPTRGFSTPEMGRSRRGGDRAKVERTS